MKLSVVKVVLLATGLAFPVAAQPVSRPAPASQLSCREQADQKLREANARCERRPVGVADCLARAKAQYTKAWSACPVERKAGEGQRDILGPEPPRDPKPPPPPPPPPPK